MFLSQGGKNTITKIKRGFRKRISVYQRSDIYMTKSGGLKNEIPHLSGKMTHWFDVISPTESPLRITITWLGQIRK